MELYRLSNKTNGFASIDFGELNMSSILKDGTIEQLSTKEFNWIQDSDNIKKSDCPFYIGALPIFKTNKVEPILPKLGVRYVSFSVEGESYTAVAAPLINGEIINRSKSTLRFFRSGKIMSVDSYVFNPKIEYSSAFRIGEYNLFTFVDKKSMELLNSCRLSELEVTACPIE